jgi:hypothetical protein
MATAYSRKLNRSFALRIKRQIIDAKPNGLAHGFGTSTAIQSSALRAPAIATPEDETEAPYARAIAGLELIIIELDNT